MALKSTLLPFTEGGRLVGARLCNFATGSDALLPSHQDWISKHFVPKIKQHPNAWVDLIGYASRLGSAAANMALSQRRIAAVERLLRAQHPGIKFNVRISKGEDAAAADDVAQANDDGYWRAVLLRWYGVPFMPEVPVYPPETPKFRTYAAPKGCWLILSVNTFGLAAVAAIGTAKLSLLNDKGELWEVLGAGMGIGAGADIGPDQWKTVAKVIASVLANLGNVPNIPGMPPSPTGGPSQTGGPILRNITWAANLTIDQITAGRTFMIVSGEAQGVVVGADIGYIGFGGDGLTSMGAGRPWGFFTGVGLGALRTGVGVTAIYFRIQSVVRKTEKFRGWSDL
jgi:hypothetical protein